MFQSSLDFKVVQFRGCIAVDEAEAEHHTHKPKKKHCGKIKHPILRAEKSCQKIAGVEMLWHIGKKRSLDYGVNPEQSE